jgi:acyl-CoA thioesterase FadM
MTWSISEHVRFRDCDAMGHVNNAVFSTYLEQARIAILGGLDPFILARVEIDFRAELHAGEEIEVRSSAPGSGRRASTSSTRSGRATGWSPMRRACSSATTMQRQRASH